MDILSLADRTARSFALTLRLLPASVREELCLAYLLARASDSVADAANRPAGERIDLLNGMAIALEASDVARFPVAGVDAFAAHVHHRGEADLLGHFGQLTGMFFAQHGDAVERGSRVLATIISGQLADVERGAGAHPAVLADEPALLDYTWRVAGCVGSYWTEVLAANVPGALAQPLPAMMELGKRYGQGLQLLNILRDAPQDWQDRRCYLPLPPGVPTPLPPDPAGLPLLFRLMRARIGQCRDWLDDGLRYSDGILGWRMRAATALPAALGHETLNALALADEAAWLKRVKISRPSLRRAAFHAVLDALLRW